jgi:UDP-N-acetyl-D-mannosaminuronic acid dehydrogenase
MNHREGAEVLVCEPNVSKSDIPLTDFSEAYEKADIVAFLTGHKQFHRLPWRNDKVILDFCGIFKKN